MSYWETGAKGDKIAGAVGNTYLKGGVERIGYEISPWGAYGMPSPTCDDDGWSLNHHVIASQKCGSQSEGGRRWGQCDQWRSSCNKEFEHWRSTAGAYTDAVKTAASALPGDKAHVSPCMFGELYSEAMYYINQCVGSYDPLTGLYIPEPDSPAYVPRWASWIFGGDAGRSNWPKFEDAWNRDTPGATAWWGGGLDNYVGAWQSKVGDGEFCRQVITASYPCEGADSYPGMCGGCASENLVGVCTNYVCSHYPLEFYQRKFSDLRMELLDAVLIYEGKNKKTLGGQTIDEACADQIVEAVVAAPPIDPEAVDATQGAYQAAMQEEKDEHAAAALLQQSLLAAQEGDGLPLGLILGGVAAVGAAIWLGSRRR